MDFILKINTDNEAFSGSPGRELSRIMRKLASRIEDGILDDQASAGRLMDANGNTVGEWEITE